MLQFFVEPWGSSRYVGSIRSKAKYYWSERCRFTEFRYLLGIFSKCVFLEDSVRRSRHLPAPKRKTSGTSLWTFKSLIRREGDAVRAGMCSLRKSLFTISTSTSWCAWRRIILQQCVRLPVRILAGLRCAAEHEMPFRALLPLLSLTVSSNNPCQIACQSRHHIPKDCQPGSSGSCKCGPLAQVLLLVAEGL